jgi:hypothetical protein
MPEPGSLICEGDGDMAVLFKNTAPFSDGAVTCFARHGRGQRQDKPRTRCRKQDSK